MTMLDSDRVLAVVSPTLRNGAQMPAAMQNPQREQLPPLRSLFDTSPHQSRHSSYGDRHSPVFPAVSPHDNRQPATPIHPDRSYDSWFQQRPPSHVYPYAYPPKQEPAGRPGSHSLPSPVGSRRQSSPRYEPRYPQSEPPRVPLVSSWPQQRPEHPSRDTSSSFRPRAEPEPVYGETASYPTPSGEPGKDTLGPKIWSGTQFFPRFVRQAEVPGEGLCYFYDDGTHCRTVIDGEAVNAHWGVTKAGKPRKRLAIACITCREKKIKCDPDFPRCVQCEKFGRVCRFKNAPRGSQGSPESTSLDDEETSPRPTSSQSTKRENRQGSRSLSPREAMQPTPDPDFHHAKRQRTEFTHPPAGSEATPPRSVQEAHSPPAAWAAPSVQAEERSLHQEWQTDPYTINPSRTSELISLVFRHVPDTISCMLPETQFKQWALSGSEKSPDDLLLLYTMLALGSVVSPKPEQNELGPRYAAVARHGCENRPYSLQLVQARVMLALYYYAGDQRTESWDICGAALRAASGMKLNVEVDETDPGLASIPFGLNRNGYAECRRRTFWACFLLDRLSGLGAAHPSWGHSHDVFLRLPCDTPNFEAQDASENPFFDPAATAARGPGSTTGCLAGLVEMASIWGDVMANLYRMSQSRAPAPRGPAFAAFYDEAVRRLREWEDTVLPTCSVSPENLREATHRGTMGTFIAMHTVYRATAMKLNRHVPTAALTAAQLSRHRALARHHAEELLTLTDTLAARPASMPSPAAHPADVYPPRELSAPFAAHAIALAVDILTRRVAAADLPKLLEGFRGAQATLAELTVFWRPVCAEQEAVRRRVTALEAAQAAAGGADVEMREPMEAAAPRAFDCVYT